MARRSPVLKKLNPKHVMTAAPSVFQSFSSVLLFLLLLSICILDPKVTYAHEEREGTQASEAKLREIVVEGRADDLVGIAETASEGTIGEEILAPRPVLRTGEILETIPGLIVTQHSGDGKANQFFLRGFNLDHGTDFRTTVDGMPVNMPSHAHGQGYTDLNFLIPELVDHIHFRKGTYYAEEGDFSAAGAAHLSLHRSLPKSIAQLTLGEYSYSRELLMSSHELGSGRLIAAIDINHYDGPWELDQDLGKYNAVLRYSGGDEDNGYSLTGMFYHNSWTSTDQIPARLVNSGGISSYGNIDPTDGGKSGRYSLSGQWYRTREDSKLRTNAYLIFSRLNLYSNFTYFLDDPINGDQFEQEERRVVFGGEASYEFAARVEGLPTKNTLGMQLRNDIIPTVALRKTKSRNELSTTRDDQIAQSSLGFYGKNETRWNDFIRSNLGIRADGYSFHVNSDTEENSGEKLAGKISPKAGLVFGPWSNTEFYLSSGLGFHSNDARGTTISVDPNTGERADQVNPLVLAKGAEIGVRSSEISHLTSTVSLWILDLSSELLFVGDAGITEPSRGSRRMGIEFSNFYQPTSWLTLDGDYSLSRARFRDSDPTGDYVPGAIESVLSGGVTVEESESGLFTSFRLRQFGPRPLIEDNSVRSFQTFLLNGRVGYKSESLVASIDLLNMLQSRDRDIEYFYESRLPGEPEAGVEDRHFHPVEPRQIRATLTYKF